MQITSFTWKADIFMQW